MIFGLIYTKLSANCILSANQYNQNIWIMNQVMTVDDFIMLSPIGKGTYAKVILVRHKKDNKLYALKILKKRYIIEKNQEEHIMT